MTTVLVTGGAGYIGSTLVEALLGAGYDVRVLDYLLYGQESINTFLPNPHFEFRFGDIRFTNLNEALKHIDYVLHLAALVGEPICKKYPSDASEINIYGSQRIFNACKKANVKGFLFFSTCSNYGFRSESDDVLDEQGQLEPTTSYAAQKVAIEKELLEQQSVPSIILRLATAYGLSKRTRLDLLLNEFVAQAVKEKQVCIYGASAWRPIAHVKDHAAAILLLLDRMSQGRVDRFPSVFNIGSNTENYRKIEIATLVADELGAKVVVDPERVEGRSYRVDFSKLKKLGFREAHSPREAIRELADAIRNGRLDVASTNCYNTRPQNLLPVGAVL